MVLVLESRIRFKSFAIISSIGLTLWVGLLLYGIQHIRFDSTDWLTPAHPYQQTYTELIDTFESDKTIAIAIALPQGLAHSETIQTLANFTASIRQLPHVATVQSPLDVTTIINDDTSLVLESVYDAWKQGRIGSIPKHLATTPYYTQFISDDFTTALVQITTDFPKASTTYHKQQLITAIQKKINQHPALRTQYWSGNMFMQQAINQETKKDLVNLALGLIILITGIIGVMFRWYSLVVLASIVAALTATIGSLVVLDYPMTSVMLILPVLVLIIMTANTIHVIARHQHCIAKKTNSPSVLRYVWTRTWRPCFLTVLTTVIGFASFSWSDIQPLAQLGRASLLALWSAYGASMATLFGLLWLSPFSSDKKPVSTDWLFSRLHTWVMQHSRKIIIGSIATIAVCLATLPGLTTQTAMLDIFFPKHSQLYQDTHYIDNVLSGSSSIDILVQSPVEDTFRSIDTLEDLQAIRTQLLAHPLIRKVNTLLDPLQLLNTALHGPDRPLPETQSDLSQSLLFLEFSRGDSQNDVLSPYVDFTYTTTRLSCITHQLSSDEISDLIQWIQQTIITPPNTTMKTTGTAVVFHGVNESILRTQLIALGITMGMIFLILWYCFGLKLAVLGIIPNALPILVTAAVGIVLKIPMDIASVLIASISLGICVDDTIHVLDYYYESGDTLETMRVVGRAICITSLLFSIGFLAFTTTDLVLLQKFGALSCLAIALAWMSDLIILPAILHVGFGNPKRPIR